MGQVCGNENVSVLERRVILIEYIFCVIGPSEAWLSLLTVDTGSFSIGLRDCVASGITCVGAAGLGVQPGCVPSLLLKDPYFAL